MPLPVRTLAETAYRSDWPSRAKEYSETEAKVRLARIGFDRVLGALADPIASFLRRPDLVEQSTRISATELAARSSELDRLQVVDIRNEGEARLGMIPGAVVVPLARLLARLDELDRGAPTVVHCAGGYRSSIGTSVLRANGFTDVSDLLGGYAAWAAAELPTTTYTPAG